MTSLKNLITEMEIIKEQLFRKVLTSERVPTNSNSRYDTNRGELSYSVEIGKWNNDLFFVDSPEWWLEPIASDELFKDGDGINFFLNNILRHLNNDQILELTKALCGRCNVNTWEWISVDDRLPDINQFALFYYGYKIPLIGCYKGDDKIIELADMDVWNIKDDEITKWAPIPKLPQK